MAGKRRLVLYVATHCTPARDDLVLALRRAGVAVDSGARCASRARDLMANSSQRVVDESLTDAHRYLAKIRVAHEYKFVLALENTIEQNYITEKLHHAYLSGAVPIVWNQSIVERHVPPHSYLAVDQFATVTALAERVRQLDSDDKAYASYFRWKDDGVPAATVAMWFRSVELIGCRLCEMQNAGYRSPGKRV